MGEELLTTESTRPLLTIAIPNFNRAGYLKELLSLLAAQLRNEPRVELIISDNASPDETPAVVQDFPHGSNSFNPSLLFWTRRMQSTN
jgi:glycosyltransferase involved in cell wall biosynthesis